jgi:hypothetical protein
VGAVAVLGKEAGMVCVKAEVVEPKMGGGGRGDVDVEGWRAVEGVEGEKGCLLLSRAGERGRTSADVLMADMSMQLRM